MYILAWLIVNGGFGNDYWNDTNIICVYWRGWYWMVGMEMIPHHQYHHNRHHPIITIIIIIPSSSTLSSSYHPITIIIIIIIITIILIIIIIPSSSSHHYHHDISQGKYGKAHDKQRYPRSKLTTRIKRKWERNSYMSNS